MQENATREELLGEIEALKQENADLKTQIEQLKNEYDYQLDSASRARGRALGLEEKVEQLEGVVKAYQMSIDRLEYFYKLNGSCYCGKEIIQPKKGRRRKFCSEACEKRFNRRVKAIKQAKKYPIKSSVGKCRINS